MKILLDTHILLWALYDSPRLPAEAKRLILDGENSIYFSTASLWEIELKHLAHPDSIPMTARYIYDCSMKAGYEQLHLRESAIFALAELRRSEVASPHKDPFDRILICQACVDGLKLLTHDALLKDYISDNILYV